MFSCRWAMLSPTESNQVILKTKLPSVEVFHGVNNGLTDVICSLCRQSILLLLVHEPKQTKPWNGTPSQHRSSRLWWVETNAVWQWYVSRAIYDTVSSKRCVTVKQAFVSLDSYRSSLEGGERCMLTAVGHLDIWLLTECCLYPWWRKVFVVISQFPYTPPSPIWNTEFSSQVSHCSGLLWLSTQGLF